MRVKGKKTSSAQCTHAKTNAKTKQWNATYVVCVSQFVTDHLTHVTCRENLLMAQRNL